MLIGIADLDAFGDCVHAFDALDRSNRSELFRVAIDVPCESRDIIVDHNTNMLAVEARIEFELINDVLPELRVGHDLLHSVGLLIKIILRPWQGDHIDPNQGGAKCSTIPRFRSLDRAYRSTSGSDAAIQACLADRAMPPLKCCLA